MISFSDLDSLFTNFFIFILIVLTYSCANKDEITSCQQETPFDIYQEDITLSDQHQFSLKLSLQESLIFLEHVYSWENQTPTQTVIAAESGTGNIFVSNDLGQSFDEVYRRGPERWGGCLTTRSDKHILWEKNSKKIFLFDRNWRLIKKVKTGDYCWHGNFSIAEFNGVIMYAEYTGDIDSAKVWRSLDDGESWELAFAVNGRLSTNPEIWHLHTLQPDPFYPGTWYLSSGDLPSECKIWKTIDGGSNWFEVTDLQPKGINTQTVHRYTAIHFDKDYIYWATDDKTDGRAKFVRAERTEPLSVEVVCDLDNLVRSMIRTDEGFIFISEQKVKNKGVLKDFTIHISPYNRKAIEIFRLKSSPNTFTGVTYSRSSISAFYNVFFSHYYGNILFKRKVGLVRWCIERKW